MLANEAGVGGDVVAESFGAIRQRSLRVNPDQTAVHVGQPVQLWIVVSAQEVVPRPRRQIQDLAIEKLLGDQTASADRRGTRAVALIVGYHREVDQHDVGAGGLEVGRGGTKKIDDGLAGLDTLPGRATDTRVLAGPRFGVGVHIHPRHAKPLPRQRLPCRGGVGRRQRQVGLGPHCRRVWNLNPGLNTPEVATGVRIVGDDDIEHLEHVGHRPGVRDHHVHGGNERPVAPHRNHSARWGVCAQSVVRRRRPPARPGLLAEPECGETRGGRRPRP